MGELRDYYDVLGVRRQAGDREIKRAYRALARRLHPDVSGTPETRDGFHELVEAYRVLSNPRSRLVYDRLGFHTARKSRIRAPEPAAEVALTFYEARLGATVPVRARVERPCAACGGDGVGVVCVACGGRGRVRRAAEDSELLLLQLVPCSACSGGRVACEACGGAGRTAEERELRVRVPAGVRDGDLLRVATVPGLIRARVAPRPVDSVLVRALALALLLAAVALLAYLLVR